MTIWLAALYQRAGADRQAITLFESALAKQPGSITALVNLGLYDASAGRLDAAIALWQRALKLNPCAVEAARNLNIALREKGDETALKELSRRLDYCVIQ